MYEGGGDLSLSNINLAFIIFSDIDLHLVCVASNMNIKIYCRHNNPVTPSPRVIIKKKNNIIWWTVSIYENK